MTVSGRRRFSVVLPVRNGGEHVKQCVASILAQTLSGDFDLLILENASTDGTAEWLTTWHDPRVSVHPAERPLSIEENWSRIKDLPKGEYVTLIGHDDLLDPQFLEVIAALIDAHPDAGLYTTHFRLIDANGAFVRRGLPMPARETAAEFLAARMCDVRDTFGTGYVMRSAAYDAMGGIPAFPKLLYADDAMFLQAIGTSYRATAFEEAFSFRTHVTSVSKSCRAAELFSALEQHGQLLARLRKNDPRLAETLQRYFPAYAAGLGVWWKRESLEAACAAQTPLDPGVDRRVTALVHLFDASPVLPPIPSALENGLLERATRSRIHRLFYKALLLQRRCYGGFERRMVGVLAKVAAINP